MPNHKVAIEFCIYNEEQFLKEVLLTTAKRLKGIEFINILDGAWKWTGGNAQSTDKTKEIVEETGNIILKKYKVDVKFGFINTQFRTQGEKRNYLLRRTEEIMKERDPEANWYHLILDGDEFIQFTTGLQDIWLNKEGAGVDQFWPKIGLLAAYAFGSPKKLLSPRFIPAFQGYHYHTDQRMVIHDKNCVSIVDYNPKQRKYAEKFCEEIPQFFLLNKWNVRDISRSLMKMSYNTVTYPNKPAECLFSSYKIIQQSK